MALNPNYADWRFAQALVLAGEPAQAILIAHTHVRLDPFLSAFHINVLRVRLLHAETIFRSTPYLRECVSRAPNYQSGRIWLAATYGQLGQLEEARSEAAKVLHINPKVGTMHLIRKRD